MEKFNRWADLTTGINPFVPFKRRSDGNLALRGLEILVGTVVCVVRVPLVSITLLVWSVVALVLLLLGWIPLLGRLLQRLVDWLLGSLLLLILGTFVTEEAANTRRLGLTTPSSKAKGSFAIARNDVIVANHLSFLEVLYLQRRFSPVFIFTDEPQAAKGLVYPMGLFGALRMSMAYGDPLQTAKPSKLQQVLQRRNGPFVIFAEGTARSNGKGVLQFVSALECIDWTTTQVHVMGFRYQFQRFSPAHTTGNGLVHWLKICFNVYHSLHVTLLHAQFLNLQDEENKHSKTITSRQKERIRGLLAAMLRIKPVELSKEDFVSFHAYWNHVTGGGRQPASAFTLRKAPHEHAQWQRE